MSSAAETTTVAEQHEQRGPTNGSTDTQPSPGAVERPRAGRRGGGIDTGNALGEYLRMRREHLGLSQGALGRASGVSPSMISRLESGKRRATPGLLYLLAEPLQVPYSQLLQRAGHEPAARRWQDQERVLAPSDPLAEVQRVLNRGPWPPAVRNAVLTLLAELARDQAATWQRRFDEAVQELERGDALVFSREAETPQMRAQVQFAALRHLLFEAPDRY
ncbi:MAG TPA: helix-turn-helix transcriptional regulator [Chloroflexota bacterium]|jgi:transcriptional regulator with XRE-family HTH domain|nr:helix-turn-helix transcriptional regulator [Chloroflexota bacterium]